MKTMILGFILTITWTIAWLTYAPKVGAAEFTVYSVYRPVDLGNAGEPQIKDFYINMGSNHGLRKGAVVNVYRKVASYDVANQKLYKDLTFAFAKMKVIHVEENAGIARVEQLLPLDQTPVTGPRAVMVGDIIRLN